MIRTTVLLAMLGALFVGLWGQFAGAQQPAAPASLPGDARGQVDRAIAAARRAVDEELNYLRADSILEALPLDSLPAELRFTVDTLLALFHAEAIITHNEDSTKTIDCLAGIKDRDPNALLPERITTRFSHLITLALTKVNQLRKVRNHAPVLAVMDPAQEVTEGNLLIFDVRASDFDGDTLTLACDTDVPVRFTDRKDGTGQFSYTPPVTGIDRKIPLLFTAGDRHAADSATVMLDIKHARGYKPPLWTRSLLIPGWGQYSAGRRTKAALFFAGAAAAWATSGGSWLRYEGLIDDYEAVKLRHSRADNPEELASAYADLNRVYDDVSGAKSLWKTARLVALALHVASAAEAMLSRPAAMSAGRSPHAAYPRTAWQPHIRVTANGASFVWTW